MRTIETIFQLIWIIHFCAGWKTDDFVNRYIHHFNLRSASIKLLQCSLGYGEEEDWSQLEGVFKEVTANITHSYCSDNYKECCLIRTPDNSSIFTPSLVLVVPGFPIHEYMFIEVKIAVIYTSQAMALIRKTHACHFFPTALDPDIIQRIRHHPSNSTYGTNWYIVAEAFMEYRRRVGDALGLELMLPPTMSDYQKFFDYYSTLIAITFLIIVVVFSKCYAKFLRHRRFTKYNQQRYMKQKMRKRRRKWQSLMEYAVNKETDMSPEGEVEQINNQFTVIQSTAAKRTAAVSPEPYGDYGMEAGTSNEICEIEYIDDNPLSDRREQYLKKRSTVIKTSASVDSSTPIIEDECETAVDDQQYVGELGTVHIPLTGGGREHVPMKRLTHTAGTSRTKTGSKSKDPKLKPIHETISSLEPAPLPPGHEMKMVGWKHVRIVKKEEDKKTPYR